ncbi:hypothetical protein [Flammeovirga sp. EKP202]|uniref:hypothetical protein n=1 Tax=Flammeovirga sp. EKP202 TaxID=2770592 RepID=UPI00165EF2BB|nr:hypothetical protein [Flammeovirga sp. EKP202]MBD0401818.1 hypothetical protein [Flammeovirga sp. EKP202]
MKHILTLGDLDRGTIHTTMETNGYTSKTKLLKSSIKNWWTIIDILKADENKELLVMGKFTEYVLFLFNLDEYKEVGQELLNLIQERKHLIFIYHNNFFGDFSCIKKNLWTDEVLEVDDEGDFIGYRKVDNSLEAWLIKYQDKTSPKEYLIKVANFIHRINKQGLNIIPYRKLVEIEIAGQKFIESIDQGLLFQLYVPKQRIWSDELDKFIVMFRDFASNVTDDDVKVVQNRTDRGITFSIYSASKKVNSDNIEELFNEFTKFLDLCVQDPKSAIEVLESTTQIPKESIPPLISKYSKEAKRLMVDMKHERERKLLLIKHELENDISEVEIGIDVAELLNNNLPMLNTPSDLLKNGNYTQNQTVILNPQYINKVEGIVSREIHGNIDFTFEDKQLSEIIEKYAEDKAELALLKSSHNELKDKSLPKSTKTVAWQKLQKFLNKAGEKIGDVGVHLLKKYLEGQLDL